MIPRLHNVERTGVRSSSAVTPVHVPETISALLAEASSLLGSVDPEDVAEVVAHVADAVVSGQQIFIVGNGGSASLASHLATDLAKGAKTTLIRPRVTALVDNTALMTALANDVGYEHVFSEQLRTYASAGDVLIAISGSGNSRNVLEATRIAHDMGVLCIAFCGFTGGRLAELADLSLIVEASSIELAEVLHSAIGHAVAIGLRESLAALSERSVKSVPTRAAIFLDRDGVLNVRRKDHVKTWDEFRFTEGAVESICQLTRRGHQIVVVTNQAAIHRGLVGSATIDDIHARMCAEVAARGGRILAVYVCPHAPSESCGCRKPRPGLLRRASIELGIDLRRSVVVGDTLSDMVAARAAGCDGILVGATVEEVRRLHRDFDPTRYMVASSLATAASQLFGVSATDRPVLRLAADIAT